MATTSVPNTFVAGTTASASEVNSNFTALVNAHNNHDSGSSIWTVMSAATIKRNATTTFPILQIVTATTTTVTNSTSSTFGATSLTASITPSATSSKIAVFATGSLGINASSVGCYATIARGGSNLVAANGLFTLSSTSTSNLLAPATLVYFDSPSSTSALTYAVYIRNSNNIATIQWGDTNETQFIMLVELGY